jgi:hypothetical protein
VCLPAMQARMGEKEGEETGMVSQVQIALLGHGGRYVENGATEEEGRPVNAGAV